MRRLATPVITRVADEAVDRILRAIWAAIAELQGIPLLRGRLVTGIELPDATNVPVHHGFGRAARAFPSVPYAISGSVTTGGILRDRTRLTADKYDPSQYVVLYAEGWGTTMYTDVWIV